MRCLYCGKELPLFKRLRGGEFCSDAHRQSYQEEYTQLALNRLLQANAAEGETPANKRKAAGSKEAKPVPVLPQHVEMESPALKRREKQIREGSLARATAPAAPDAKRLDPAAQRSGIPMPAAALPVETAPAPAPAANVPPMAKAVPIEDPPARRAAAPQVSQIPQPLEPDASPSAPPVPDSLVTELTQSAEPQPDAAPLVAMAEYLAQVPVAVIGDTAASMRGEIAIEARATSPRLPQMFEYRYKAERMELPESGLVPVARLEHRDGPVLAPLDRTLEVRDFVRSLPVVEIKLAPAAEIGLVRVEEPLELKFGYQRTSESPRLWQELERAFPLAPLVLGEMARLDFNTSGWNPEIAAETAVEEEIPPAPAPQVEFEPVRFERLSFEPVPAERARPVSMPFEPVRIDPVFIERMSATVTVESPAPVAAESTPAEVEDEAPVVVETVVETGDPGPVLEQAPGESVAEASADVAAAPDSPELPPVGEEPPALAVSQVSEETAPAAEAPAAPPIPDPVAKPLPVTLHGLAPVRGRSVQVFSTGLTRTADVLPPPQTALPLRPLMVLGPAPQSQTQTKEPAPLPVRKQETAPPAAVHKPRKSDVRVLSLGLNEDVPSPKFEKKGEPVAKPDPVPETKAPEAPAAAAKSAPKETPAAPLAEQPKREPVEIRKPLSTPPTPPDFGDLGLPKLAFQGTTSFWTRIPAIGRIGIAAGVLALVAGGILLTSRGTSAPHAGKPSAPVLQFGPAIGADEGWIADWFSEGLGERQRHVDVLRGSMHLRDYRVQFEAQIERQAVGWVFRASNKDNFYAEKLAVGSGLAVELVRFAVIKGKEQPRQHIPLSLQGRFDTVYKIRTEVVGHQFTTYLQDQQVDQWTDDRIESGGVGLYYDNGDIPKLKGSIDVLPLRDK